MYVSEYKANIYENLWKIKLIIVILLDNGKEVFGINHIFFQLVFSFEMFSLI